MHVFEDFIQFKKLKLVESVEYTRKLEINGGYERL